MNKLRKLISKLPKRLTKTYIVTALVLAVLGVAGGFAVKAEFYPDRATYDYNKPCNPNDSDIYDRCGSLTGPVFNSFVNTPSYGDERAFFDARRSDQTASGSFKNVLTDVTGGSKEVVLRTYIHNNANQSTNGASFDGIGVARDSKVRIALPSATSNTLRARSYISASNAKPALVEDTVDLVSGTAFSVEYVKGSAKLYNNGPFKSGVTLSDNIVGSGAPIGHASLNGKIPGCFEYEAVVQVRVKIIPKQNPDVSFSKQVAVPGQSAWGEKVSVKPGDNVKWLVSFANKGQVDLTNVNVSDKLPPHLNVVPSSVRWIYTGTDGSTQDVKQSDTQIFTTGGINFGTWKPNGGFYVRFETTAKDDFEGCSVTLRNIAYNKTTQTSRVEDFADVTITKPNCVPDKPIYACELLSAKLVRGRTYDFTVDANAAGGATITSYTYNFGDGSEPLTTDKTTVRHTYTKAGTFVSTVDVNVRVNGETKTVTSESCKAVIIEKDKPGQPKELAKTGPGSALGIFTGTSLAGAFLHRKWTLRKSK